MRADRLLATLLLLQTHGKLTAEELSRRLEVSVRSVYRDVEALSAAGVPVYAERGRNGGITLVPGYRTDLTGLSPSEAQALFVFSGRGAVEELGLGDDLRQAIRKLLATVPDAYRDDAARISQRVVVDPHSWRRTSEPFPHLAALQEAVLDDRRARIRYPSRSAQADRDYEIEPYGLVAKAGVWYLLANTDAGTRTFRVSRVRTVQVLADRFDRPPDLDVEALWTASRSRFLREVRPSGFLVAVLVEPQVVEIVRRTADLWLTGPLVDEGRPDGRLAGELEVSGADHAVRVLAPYGGAVEATAPREVRDALRSHAAAIAERYRT